ILEENDGITVYLNTHDKAFEAPERGVFSLFLSAKGDFHFKEGTKGKWIDKDSDAIKVLSRLTKFGYQQEMAIPWGLVGGKPALNTRIGLNVQLTENAGTELAEYTENISSNDEEGPFSWLTLKLK